MSSLPPIRFNEQFSTLTGEILISTGNDGGTAGLDTAVFGADGLLYDGFVVGCGIWHSELDVSVFRDAKFRLRERDLVCDELGRFRAGSDGLWCMLLSLKISCNIAYFRHGMRKFPLYSVYDITGTQKVTFYNWIG